MLMIAMPVYSFVAVELMRTGVEPTAAAVAAIHRISHLYPSSSAGLVALNMTGGYGICTLIAFSPSSNKLLGSISDLGPVFPCTFDGRSN